MAGVVWDQFYVGKGFLWVCNESKMFSPTCFHTKFYATVRSADASNELVLRRRSQDLSRNIRALSIDFLAKS